MSRGEKRGLLAMDGGDQTPRRVDSGVYIPNTAAA